MYIGSSVCDFAHFAHIAPDILRNALDYVRIYDIEVLE